MCIYHTLCNTQITLLVSTLWLSSFLASIKHQLCPGVSDVTKALVSKVEMVSKMKSKAQVDARAWKSRELLLDPPYLSLPESEPPNALRDKVRRLFKFRPPRNKHEQLFGVFGASGPRVLAFLVQNIFLMSSILMSTNLALIESSILLAGIHIDVVPLVSEAVESLFVGRLLVLLPSLIILALMPGLMIKLNYAISTEELTKTALLQDIMRDSRRGTFLASLRSLIAFTVLSGDGENNIMNKLAQIKAREAALKTNPKALPVPRRSAEEDNRALNVYSREELGLLEAAFVQGADDWEREGAAVGITLNAPQVASVLMSLGLSLSDEDAKVLFDFMDRDGNGSIDLLEFASVLILPLSGPVTAGLFEEGVERLFKILDQNGDGQVTLDEFRSEMAKVFPNWNPDALVPLFREIDSGESGAIDKNEFLAYFRNVL